MAEESKKAYGQMLREGRSKEKERKSSPLQATTLRLWFKDGRRSLGFPWMLYAGDEWVDQGKNLPERLMLFFGEKTITVTGFHLRALLETLDEGGLQVIREHDTQEIDLLRAQNAKQKSDHTPIIVRIQVLQEEGAHEGGEP